MDRQRALTFKGTSEEFGEYLNFIRLFCELNPDITLGQFAWRNHAIPSVKYVWTNGANDV